MLDKYLKKLEGANIVLDTTKNGSKIDIVIEEVHLG